MSISRGYNLQQARLYLQSASNDLANAYQYLKDAGITYRFLLQIFQNINNRIAWLLALALRERFIPEEKQDE